MIEEIIREEPVSMEEAAAAVRYMLKKRELKFSYDEDAHAFRAAFGRSNSPLGTLILKIYLSPSRRDPERCIRITAYTTVGFNAPLDHRAAIAEYLHRANYGMVFGHFEMDYDDGEVRFKLGFNTVDGLPGFDAIDDLFLITTSTMERYADGLLIVGMGLATPQEAVEKMEAADD